MALHTHNFGGPSGLPLSTILAAVPSYPRPLIERLVARMIDRLDELDGDADLEDADEDRCLAGDDGVFTGPIECGAFGVEPIRSHFHIGADEDAEAQDIPDSLTEVRQ